MIKRPSGSNFLLQGRRLRKMQSSIFALISMNTTSHNMKQLSEHLTFILKNE